MAILPNLYINAVVAIGTGDLSDINWVGTGFLVGRVVDSDGGMKPFLVTNRHVLKDKENIIVRLRKKDSDDFVTVKTGLYENKNRLFVVHSNDAIDIAVLPLNASFFINNQLAFNAFNIDDDHAMTSEELRDAGADEGSLIHMLGFPMGLVNENSTIPICRLGCIARMSKAQVEESHNILVDIQNFPGNSGSPVVVRPELTAIEGTKALNKCVLLGIVHSYLPYQEKLINSQTKKVVEIRSENSGLALVHPVEYIREVIDIVEPKKLDVSNQEAIKTQDKEEVVA